ncbi:MAG: hypothetical protein EBY65_04930, partial [Acidimicrobiia bacterium]|nr:hypothetical protein [Acidimicrobiia bacterium]
MTSAEHQQLIASTLAIMRCDDLLARAGVVDLRSGSALEEAPLKTRITEMLGVEIPPERQQKILGPLGFRPEGGTNRWLAPTWRRDCWREIDLVEEIARIEGYDRVPENVPIAARPVNMVRRGERKDSMKHLVLLNAPEGAVYFQKGVVFY